MHDLYLGLDKITHPLDPAMQSDHLHACCTWVEIFKQISKQSLLHYAASRRGLHAASDVCVLLHAVAPDMQLALVLSA